MVSVHDEHIGRARFGRPLNDAQQAVRANLNHLLEPTVALQRRSTGGRAVRRVVVKQIAKERDCAFGGIVGIANRQEFAASPGDQLLS